MYKTSIFFLLYLTPICVLADFINSIQADKCETILEVFIEEERIVVKMEIGENDYQWFSDIIPRSYFKEGYLAKDQNLRWAHFVRTQLVLESGNKTLMGKLNLVEKRNQTQRTGLNAVEADSTLWNKKILYAEITYPINSNTSILSITPPMEPGSAATPANIGFIVYHNNIPVNDLSLLTAKEALHLDWEDPWYSYFENRSISRHHKSSFMSFLYIEPYEVRHEILGRIKDLEEWLGFSYEMNDVIRVRELDSLKNLIAKFLVKRNTVTIDGIEIKPIIDRVNFVEINLAGVQIIEIPKPLPYASAIIGVIFAYPHKSLPKEVILQWDLFNEKIQRVPCMSIDPAGPWPYDLLPSENVVKWTNFLKHYKLPTISEQKVEASSMSIPIFSIVCLLMILFVLFRNNWTLRSLSRWRKFFFVLYILLGILSYPIGYKVKIPFMKKSNLSTDEAADLINHLLRNTYRAFDFREEEDIYDKLALSTTEELLQQVYLETRSSLVIENQGDLEARVEEVLVIDVQQQQTDEDGLAFRCKWIAKGVVGHWGHKHQRINQYEAIIKIAVLDDTWKMYDMDIIEEVRL